MTDIADVLEGGIGTEDTIDPNSDAYADLLPGDQDPETEGRSADAPAPDGAQ